PLPWGEGDAYPVGWQSSVPGFFGAVSQWMNCWYTIPPIDPSDENCPAKGKPLNISNQLDTNLPLPKGEGRGEGEQDGRMLQCYRDVPNYHHHSIADRHEPL